jgi:putative membrane protein
MSDTSVEMANATAPIEQADAQRLHPATLLLSLGKIGPRAMNFAPGLIAVGVFSDVKIAILAALGFLLVGFAFDVLQWMRFTYHVGADDVRIDSGVFERSHTVIPFARIQDVGIEQGPVARILGLAKVRLETGGQGAIIKEDGVLNVISLGDAEGLRENIRAYRTKIPAVSPDGVIAETSLTAQPLLFSMNLRRILIAGLFNFSLTLFAALFALMQTFDDVLPINVFNPEDWIDLIGKDNPIFSYIDAHRWLVAILGLATVAVLGVITGMITTLLREYGYRLTRTENGLRRTRGLLTKTDVSLPIRRVQAAVVKSGLIQRRFGWRTLALQSLAGDEDKQADHVAAPLATRDESNQILAELNLTEAEPDLAWQPVHAIHRWGALPLLLILMMAVLIAAFLISLWFWIIMPALFFMAGLYWYQRARHGWHFDGRVLHIRRAGWGQRFAIIPARNIQSADLSQGPIYRRFGLASLHLGIAGGGTINPHGIDAISWAEAAQLRQALLKAQR